MFNRLLPLFLLGLSLLVPMQGVSPAPPTIELVVPSYNYPHAEATLGEGIANNGTIVGQYVLVPTHASYFRLPNGHFSAPISVPDSLETDARGVNNAGVVCGTFVSLSTAIDHGFFFDGSTYTQYDVDVSGAVHTDITGENDAGDFVGFYITDPFAVIGFVNVGGVFTSFSVAGSDETFPQAINNLGQVVGYYEGVNHQGFFRDADGTLIFPIDYPGSTFTEIYGLNDRGLMVGTWESVDSDLHAFVRNPANHFVSYDYPDERFSFTVFTGINNSGVISAFAQDGSLFSFIARIGR